MHHHHILALHVCVYILCVSTSVLPHERTNFHETMNENQQQQLHHIPHYLFIGVCMSDLLCKVL